MTQTPYKTEKYTTMISNSGEGHQMTENRKYNFSEEKLQKLMFDKKHIDMYVTFDQPIYREKGNDIKGTPENQSNRFVFANTLTPISEISPYKKIKCPTARAAFKSSAQKHIDTEIARGVTHVITLRNGSHVSMEKGDTVYDKNNQQIWPKPETPKKQTALKR